MDRSYASGAAGSAPAAPASPSIGYPTAGNPATGTPATKPGPYWYHQITEELLAIISAAGITPAQGTLTQLASAIQSGKLFSSAAGGTADALTASFVPTVSSLINGMSLYVRAGSVNVTTTPTFTPASGTIAAKTIVKGAGGALSAGDIAGGGHWIELQYDLTLDKWVLLNPATGVSISTSAPPVVGSSRNAKMVVTAASASGTFTADAAIVDTTISSAPGGSPALTLGVNSTINLATTGIGGMDTSSAPTSGFVSLYYASKPDGTKGMFACNVTASSGSVYTGANMPVGYTRTALAGIWPTDGTGKFVAGDIGYGDSNGRRFQYQTFPAIFTGHADITSLTSQSISGAVPLGAKTATAQYMLTGTGNPKFAAAGDTTGTGGKMFSFTGTAGSTNSIGGMPGSYSSASCPDIPLLTAQTIYVLVASGTSNNSLYVSDYTW